MESKEPATPGLDEVISEIASILVEGYLRHRKGCRLTASSQDMADLRQSRENEALAENRLESSGNMSIHSCRG